MLFVVILERHRNSNDHAYWPSVFFTFPGLKYPRICELFCDLIELGIQCLNDSYILGAAALTNDYI